MTWEEIDYEFSIAPIWIDWLTTHLTLNAQIEFREKYNKNVLSKIDNYYKQQFAPVAKHSVEHLNTISKFKNKTIRNGISNDYPMVKHWENIMKSCQ